MLGNLEDAIWNDLTFGQLKFDIWKWPKKKKRCQTIGQTTNSSKVTLHPTKAFTETIHRTGNSKPQVTIIESVSAPNVMNTIGELLSNFRPAKNVTNECIV